jgi:hypothetical protein
VGRSQSETGHDCRIDTSQCVIKGSDTTVSGSDSIYGATLKPRRQTRSHLAEHGEAVVARHRIDLQTDKAIVLQDHDHAYHVATAQVVDLCTTIHANAAVRAASWAGYISNM